MMSKVIENGKFVPSISEPEYSEDCLFIGDFETPDMNFVEVILNQIPKTGFEFEPAIREYLNKEIAGLGTAPTNEQIKSFLADQLLPEFGIVEGGHFVSDGIITRDEAIQMLAEYGNAVLNSSGESNVFGEPVEPISCDKDTVSSAATIQDFALREGIKNPATIRGLIAIEDIGDFVSQQFAEELMENVADGKFYFPADGLYCALFNCEVNKTYDDVPAVDEGADSPPPLGKEPVEEQEQTIKMNM